MSRQATHTPYPNLLYRFVFNDEATTLREGGTPTNVTFDKGKAGFNGTSSKVNYDLGLNGTYSVRIKCNPTNFVSYNLLLDCTGTDNNGIGFIYFNITNGIIIKTSGESYINGTRASTGIAGVNNEVVITNITLIEGTGANKTLIGSNRANNNEFLGTIDFIEIYKGTLTASEVANLYSGKWNKEQRFGGGYGSNLVVNGDFTNGSNDWNLVLGCTVQNNSLVFDGLTYFPNAVQNNIFEANKKYSIRFDAVVESGLFYIYAGSTSNGITARLVGSTTSGSKDVIVTSLFTENLQIVGWGYFAGSITNIVIKEVKPETLFDFNSTQGVLEEQTGKTLTASNVTLHKTGSNYAALFNGSDSIIDTGFDMIGTKAVTIMGWIYLNGWGASGLGYIIDNGEVVVNVYSSSKTLRLYTGTNLIESQLNRLSLNKWFFIAVQMGTVNSTIYIGDLNNTPAQSGSTQATGTIIAGDQNLFIGNKYNSSRGSDGLIPMIKIVEGILPLEDISRFWSETRKDID